MNLEEYCTLLQLALEPEAQNNEVLPLWVRNLSSKLDDSVFKELFPLLLADPNDPKSAGFAIGAKKLNLCNLCLTAFRILRAKLVIK